jgi:ABC-2 type transport system ATP-binding protein
MRDAAIRTTALSKTYGAVEALKQLDLSVETGEIFGLIGHNGAGKTTTVNLLTTLIAPTGGTAQINGVDMAADPDEVRRGIGYLPENVQF